jgi:hypothetical protein
MEPTKNSTELLETQTYKPGVATNFPSEEKKKNIDEMRS